MIGATTSNSNDAVAVGTMGFVAAEKTSAVNPLGLPQRRCRAHDF